MTCSGHCTHVKVSETVKLWRRLADAFRALFGR